MEPIPYIIITRGGKPIGIATPVPVPLVFAGVVEDLPAHKAQSIPSLYVKQVDDLLAECESGPDPSDPRNSIGM